MTPLYLTNGFGGSFVLALPGMAYRIKVRERLLIQALGQPYRDYFGRTKRLVPFLV